MMRRIALPVALAAVLAACAGSPTAPEPGAARRDTGYMGSGGGRTGAGSDSTGTVGSGCCVAAASVSDDGGLIGSGVGRSGVVGPGGGRTETTDSSEDGGHLGSGVGAL